MAETTLDQIQQRLRAAEVLLADFRAKDAVRATLMRYMDLCDVPGPLESLDQVGELFTEDAVWEGLGPEYAGKFGRVEGRAAVARHVGGYLPPSVHFVRNAHLVGSEQLTIDGDRATGQWLMQQLSSYDPSLDKGPELLCARLTIDFTLEREVDGERGETVTALISHFRTQRLFAAPLDSPEPLTPNP